MSAARAMEGYPSRWDVGREEKVTMAPRVRGRRKASPVARLGAFFGLLGLLLMLYVAEQALVVTLTYRLTGVQAAIHAATVETEQLQLRMSELSSLDRIEKIAREELHLVSPAAAQYLSDAEAVPVAPPSPEASQVQPTVVARLHRFFAGAVVQTARAAQR
ncbi:MAG: hypothetical protein ACM3RP_07285 [Chitinophagales bacterium]